LEDFDTLVGGLPEDHSEDHPEDSHSANQKDRPAGHKVDRLIDHQAGVDRNRDVFVEPEKVVPVRVSNRDVNRVNCAGQILDATYSQEKPVRVMPGGANNLYVKFLSQRDGGGYTYVTDSVDLHVVCGNSVYTIILYPHPMDSVTIRLEGKSDHVEGVVKDWGRLSLEDRIKRLVIAVWKGEIPPGFSRKTGPADRKEIFEDMDIEKVYSMQGTGSGLSATEYSVKALRPVSVDERYFLRPEFGNVIAITVDPLVLRKSGDKARLIIVERSL